MFDFSPVQIIIVLAIALLVFGPKRLPVMGRDLGRGIRDFKSGLTGEETPPARPAAPAAAPPPAPARASVEGEDTPPVRRVVLAPARR